MGDVELQPDPVGSNNGQLSSDKHNTELTTNESPNDQSEPSRCAAALNSCCTPCLAETHPLPDHPTMPQRCLNNFLCPPHSRAGAILFVVFVFAAMWTTLYSMMGEEALPGGNLFSLLVLFMACWAGGWLVGLVKLPPLLGMLIVGGILGNVSPIDVAKDINHDWSSGCRQMALTIILIRAGLGLDPKALKKLSFVVIRLAFSPCLTETVVDAIASHFILGLPWPWAFMLGFIIAAVSPAVVVPSLLGLSDRGYGLDKGIPTLVIAAASIDDVLAITGFGVMLGISFSKGDIVWTLFKGPLEAIVGVIYGIVGGVLLWYLPQKKSKNHLLFRSTLLLLLCLIAIFGSKKIEWSGAGPLAALSLPFVAALRWRTEFPEGEKNPIENVVGVLWMVFQPLLFGLIGAEVDIASLNGDTVGLGIAVLAIGLFFRIIVSYLSVMRTELNFKERLFIPFAWMPKATVQAAVGAVALDTARTLGMEEEVELGKTLLNIAVLSIILTAPLGAVIIAILGPILLHRSEGSHAAGGSGSHDVEGSRLEGSRSKASKGSPPEGMSSNVEQSLLEPGGDNGT